MNSKIKFRAWDKENKWFIYPDSITWDTQNNVSSVFQHNNTPEIVYLLTDDILLQQFTGLRDKNNKEIYEGDIYKTPGSNYLRYVFFHNGAFCGGRILEDSTPLNWEYSEEHDQVEIDNFVSCIEVVGNIYETLVTS